MWKQLSKSNDAFDLEEKETSPVLDKKFKRTEQTNQDDQDSFSIDDADAKGGQNISDAAAMVHLIKGNIGTGILAMPSAILNAGLAVGAVGLTLIAVITIHCMHLIVSAASELSVRNSTSGLVYGDVARLAFRPFSRNLSEIARILVDVFICITQLGASTVYVLFVATSIQQIILHTLGRDLELWVLILAIWFPFVACCLVRNLKWIAPMSMIATVSELFCLACVFYYIFKDPLPELSSVSMAAPIAKLPLFFGTAIFTFEGIGVVLPLQVKMKQPQHFSGFCGVLNIGMFVVATMYLLVGVFGYIRYGAASAVGSITLNLPEDDVLALLARIAITIAIFLTYPLQFHIAITIIVPNLIEPYVSDGKRVAIYEYITRIIFVSLTCLLAATIPYLDLFISLSGALCMTGLSLIAPAAIDIAIHWETIRWYGLAKNAGILLLGLAGSIAGTIIAVMEITQKFKDN